MPALPSVGDDAVVAERATPMVVGGRRVLVAALEDVITSKAAAARDKDVAALPGLRATLAVLQEKQPPSD